jgi:thioester reductase-like protein
MAQRTVLFTGFPGFLGARLIPKLLADDRGARVVALVEPRMLDRAESAAARLGLGRRLVVQAGDITDPGLGLEPRAYARLAKDTVAIHHLAAVYDLAVGAPLAERVNVVGTQNVVDFARRCAALERHNYVSTAYVAGTRSGLVTEAELTCGQAFKNHYESTKFAAEVIVRASMHDVPTTIYRPAIVVGDSHTGETQKFDGPYYLLRTVSALRRLTPQIGSEAAPMNIVPVDYVIDAIAAASRDRRADGRTLHLTDPDPVTSAQLFIMLAREYGGYTPGPSVPPWVVERLLGYPPIRALLGGAPPETIAYLNHPVRFDTSNATEILEPHGITCPPPGDYAEPMVRFFRAHERDRAYRPPNNAPTRTGPVRAVGHTVGLISKSVGVPFRVARGLVAGVRSGIEVADPTTVRAVADMAVNEARSSLPRLGAAA